MLGKIVSSYINVVTVATFQVVEAVGKGLV